MEPAYASKKELLSWISGLLSLQVSELNELISGAAYCQVLDVFFAGVVLMNKVDFLAYKYEQCILNYKILQLAFDKLKIRRDVDIKKMLDGHQGTLLELLQWMYKFCYGRDTQPGYNPVERRRSSKHGGTSRIPTFGISNGAFKKWRLTEEKQNTLGGAYNEPVVAIRRENLKSGSYAGAANPSALRTTSAVSTRRLSSNRIARPDSASAADLYSNGRGVRSSLDPSVASGPGNGASPSPSVSEGLKGASDVAAEAVAGLTTHLTTFQRLALALSEGAMQTYIGRGKMRSFKDVLKTLNRHTALLLKDISLRLDLSHSPKDVHLRVQVDTLTKELSAAQQSLEFVANALQEYEARAAPPREGIAQSGGESVSSDTIQSLDLLLRKVGSAQASLPDAREAATFSHSGLFVHLQDVDAATKIELKGQQPQFFDTSTSVAFKVGNFQVRKLRNGDIYKGRYFASKKAGDGHYAFLNGDVYEGEFVDDHMEGFGVYTFSSQGRYEGQWHAALYSGLGTETFAKGSTYHGTYHKGNRSGFGVCRYYNGDYYEGEWLDGLRSGSGMQQCTDDSNYVGEYRNGKRHGYGVYTFPNGDSFMGQYELDMPHGVGVYMFGGGQSYEGRWQNGKKHGLCEYVVESGEQYAGEWENGKPKWVQSLSLDTGKSELVSHELAEKMASAHKAAEEARRAADVGREKAVQHWQADGEIQTNIRQVLADSEKAAADAQQARARAMALAFKLDEYRRKEAGPTGWPAAVANARNPLLTQ